MHPSQTGSDCPPTALSPFRELKLLGSRGRAEATAPPRKAGEGLGGDGAEGAAGRGDWQAGWAQPPGDVGREFALHHLGVRGAPSMERDDREPGRQRAERDTQRQGEAGRDPETERETEMKKGRERQRGDQEIQNGPRTQCIRAGCTKTHCEVGHRDRQERGVATEGGARDSGTRRGEKKRGRERRGRIVPQGGKERQTQSPGCSHRASLNRLGGQEIPDGPHLGGCGHPVAPQGPEGIVGLARRGWEYGAQDREPFSRPGWVQASRPPSRVTGEPCGWSPAGGKTGAGGWNMED